MLHENLLNTFFKKLYQSKYFGDAISLSTIGLQIISRAILSEIVRTYNMVLVCITNYIFYYIFSGDFVFKGL